MTDPIRPDDDATDAQIWELLDRHPHLKSDAGFASRVRAAVEREASGAVANDARGPRRARTGARIALVAALLGAAALLLVWLRTGDADPGASVSASKERADATALAARIEEPPPEVLRDLELLRDLDLLEGDASGGDLAILLDLADLELLDHARALWEEEAEGGG